VSALADLLARAHLPLALLPVLAGLAIAAGSSDLMKRLLGAAGAMFVAVGYLALLAGPAHAGAGLAGAVLAFAGLMLGLVAIVRLREGFGAVSGDRVRAGLDDDAARAERDA
jgi:hypothetical protein